MNPKPAILPPEEELRDLGFGALVARESRERLLNRDGSFNVARRATDTDRTFSQMVHARSSYKPHEIAWNARFTDIFRRPPRGGRLAVDIGRIHGIEEFTLPEGSRS